ncbi:MAG: hypothetical protein JF614_22415 [Acidobacteria bacterium]|nr:hypothetical protein [Acidobacteriota bacterium]
MNRALRLAGLILLLAALPAAAGLEDDLNARWRGGFVVVKLALASNCDSFYNDNDLVGSRVDSSARRRFGAGELARVERIGVKRDRVDVFLDLAEGVLEESHDGPFTLYEPRTCKVQLKVPTPDPRGTTLVNNLLSQLLELHADAREAESSPSWNRRRREPFPKDYEKTLAAHEAWKAEQTNAAIQTKMDEAIEEASRIGERVHSDHDYLDGFAAGMDKVRDRTSGDCGSLLNGYFSPSSGGGGKSSEWKRGYEDGQRLGHDLDLLRRLRSCFVPVR